MFTLKTITLRARLAACVMLFLLVQQAGAGDATISLDQLLQQLLQNNPQIQAAESRRQSLLARPAQASALPDPVVSFVSRNANGSPVPFTTLGDDPLSSIGFLWEQEIPYPGKLKLAEQIAEKQADSATADVDEVKWAVIVELKQAYYEYFRTDRSLAVLQESLDFLRRVETITESKYAVGQSIQQDVIRAQLEISVLNQRITRMEQEKASAAAAINRVLNVPMDSPVPIPGDVQLSTFSVPLDALQQEYAAKAPTVLSSAAMLEAGKLNLDLAEKQKRPDFMSSIEYDNSPNFPDMWVIQFGVRVPLFYKKKQNLAISESAYNLTRAEKELIAKKQQVAFDIKNEYLQIQSSETLLSLYQKAIIPQAQLALESSIASYQVGKADFLTTLSNFSSVLEYRISTIEELSKHESAIARLEQAVGHTLAHPSTEGGRSHE